MNALLSFLRPAVIVGPLPNTITNGQTSDAVPVMANWNWIISQVNANAAALALTAQLASANNFTNTQTITAGTATTNTPALSVTQTLNSGAVAFTSFLFAITNTASAAGSLLFDFQVGGVSKYSVGIAGAVTEVPRAVAYQFTAWDPSDVAGTFTNAPATAAASLTATNYMTMANSLGTLTLTAAKAGNYLVDVCMQNEAAQAYSKIGGRITLGGTATRFFGPTVAVIIGTQLVAQDSLINIAGTLSFMVSATAGQTLTILPAISVVSPGATTDFTTNCSVTASYQGTT